MVVALIRVPRSAGVSRYAVPVAPGTGTPSRRHWTATAPSGVYEPGSRLSVSPSLGSPLSDGATVAASRPDATGGVAAELRVTGS